MSVFQDKKFENLDWISQATEPIDSKLNEVLGAIPESIPLDFNLYKKYANQWYGSSLHLENAIDIMALDYANVNLSHDEKKILTTMFKIEMSSPEILIDFEKGEIIGGEITIVKIGSTMDEKVLEGLLGKEGIQACTALWYDRDSIPRINEVLEILGGCELGLRTRSERKKRIAMKERLTKIFKNNEWNVKDTELANKIGFWIKDYIITGNIAAFSNFCRLKVMTHKGQPIYSMEEVV